jgi:hypothetical protein
MEAAMTRAGQFGPVLFLDGAAIRAEDAQAVPVAGPNPSVSGLESGYFPDLGAALK